MQHSNNNYDYFLKLGSFYYVFVSSTNIPLVMEGLRIMSDEILFFNILLTVQHQNYFILEEFFGFWL